MGLKSRVFYSANVCLLPSSSNDYRPLALRHRSLAAASAMLIALKVLALTVVAVTPNTAELSTITAARIVQLTNAERVNVGLDSLTVSSQLTSAAEGKAKHMLDEDYFAHISPSGVTPWFWISQAGYVYQIAGENLAIDFLQAEDVVAAWLASPSHKDNMLHSSYTETGVAVATGEFQGGTSIVVVHMFGTPTGASAPQAAGETTATPTPTPSPSTSPIPTPTTDPVPVPVPDETPPRTPRIAIVNAVQPVQDQLLVNVEGEPGSIVHILVNNQEVGQVVLDASGAASHEVDIAGASDGTLIVHAFATDGATNQSDDSEVVTIVKDTEGPELVREAIAFVLSPRTDVPSTLLTVAHTSDDRIAVTTNGETREHSFSDPILVTPQADALSVALLDQAGNASAAYDVRLKPAFSLEADQSLIQAPAKLTRDVRVIIGLISMVILLLLSIAILVHIRVQRPALIAHASFLFILGMILFLL